MRVLNCGPSESVVIMNTDELAVLIGERIGDTRYSGPTIRHDQLESREYDLSATIAALRMLKAFFETRDGITNDLQNLVNKMRGVMWPLDPVVLITAVEKKKGKV